MATAFKQGMPAGKQHYNTLPHDVEAGQSTPVLRDCYAGEFVAQVPPDIRTGFIRKVYSLLAIQMVVTVGISCLMMLTPSIRMNVLDSHSSLPMMAMIGSLACFFALYCNRHKHPTNLILLAVWTLVEGFSIGVLCCSYYQNGKGWAIAMAFAMTAVIFLSLSAYTIISKKNFNFLGGGLFSCLWILIFWGILMMFFPSNFAHTMYALFGSLLFSGYILYDTSLLLHTLTPDEYILAVVMLYLDIINLFLMLLRLISGGRND